MSLAAIFDSKARFDTLSNVTNSLCSSSQNQRADITLLRDQISALSQNQTTLSNAVANIHLELISVRTQLATHSLLADTLVSNKKMTDFEAKIRAEMTEADTLLRTRIQHLERANTLLANRVRDLETNQQELTATVIKLNSVLSSMTESAHAVNQLVLSQVGNSDKLDAILTHLKIPAPTLTTVGLTMPQYVNKAPTFDTFIPTPLVVKAE